MKSNIHKASTSPGNTNSDNLAKMDNMDKSILGNFLNVQQYGPPNIIMTENSKNNEIDQSKNKIEFTDESLSHITTEVEHIQTNTDNNEVIESNVSEVGDVETKKRQKPSENETTDKKKVCFSTIFSLSMI